MDGVPARKPVAGWVGDDNEGRVRIVVSQVSEARPGALSYRGRTHVLRPGPPARDNRVAKIANGTTTRYLVDDLNPTGVPQVVEELTGGVVTRQYTYGLQRISQNQPVGQNWTPSFYEYDGGGNVRQLTDSSGSVTDTYEYDAWGNTIYTAGNTPNEFYYRSEQWDSDLGLYYLRARYYNPQTGRFLSQDPHAGDIFEPKSLHRYNYAALNPVNRIDPTGLDAEEKVELGEIGEGAEAGERTLAKDINCALYTYASLLLAVSPQPHLVLVSFQVEASECGAESEREGENCFLCFGAGTPIHTNRGDVPVEAVEVGDEVLARNRTTGKLEYERVSALTPPHHDKLLEIRVEGEHDPLHPSTAHPFWVKRGDQTDGQWMPSGQMQVGDRLLTINCQWRRVTAITPLPGEKPVYNFTVANDHDYFVGQTGFLVHNANCGPCGYRRKFFNAYPWLQGLVWVHHAIPQAVPRIYPGTFTPDEIGDLGNLRGIPNDINSDLHLSKINSMWNDFYRNNPDAMREEIQNFANEVDAECGDNFLPVNR